MSKLIIYQKNQSKPIIISDKDQDRDVLSVVVEKMFKSSNIFRINTDNDCLFVRPSEVQSILITDTKDEVDRRK